MLGKFEGSVAISLSVCDEHVTEVRITSERMLLAHKLLSGKRADEVTSLVSMIFRLCGRAQAFAAASALGSVQDTSVAGDTLAVRQQLVRMEFIREHLWRVLLDWPVLMGLPSQGDVMKQVLKFDAEWVQVLDGKGVAFQSNKQLSSMAKGKASKVAMVCGTFLKEHVFYMPPKEFYACQDLEQFFLWAKYTQTGAARMLHWLISRGLAGIGNADVNTLPALDDVWLEDKLSSDVAGQFISCPSLDGKACETTPFSRQRGHALIKALVQKFGPGLLARYVAVLLEIAEVYAALEASLKQRGMETKHNKQSGFGLGTVEAARGRLLHRVVLKGDTVEDYQIVAPTEWNFHPEGVLKQALLGIKGDAVGIDQKAKLLIHAMDPCVQFSLQVKRQEKVHA